MVVGIALSSCLSRVMLCCMVVFVGSRGLVVALTEGRVFSCVLLHTCGWLVWG